MILYLAALQHQSVTKDYNIIHVHIIMSGYLIFNHICRLGRLANPCWADTYSGTFMFIQYPHSPLVYTNRPYLVSGRKHIIWQNEVFFCFFLNKGPVHSNCHQSDTNFTRKAWINPLFSFQSFSKDSTCWDRLSDSLTKRQKTTRKSVSKYS